MLRKPRAAILLFVFTAETVYFSFYKTICGLSALSYGGQVMEFFSSILIHVWKNILVILVYFVSFIALMILEKKRFIKHNKIDYKLFYRLKTYNDGLVKKKIARLEKAYDSLKNVQ